MIDEVIARAYMVWRENAGLLIFIGILSWTLLFLLVLAFSVVVGLIAVAFGTTDPQAIPEWVVTTVLVASSTLMVAFSINGNYAVRRKILPLSRAIRFSLSRILETGTAILFFAFPAVTGTLIALLVITLLGEAWSWLGFVFAVVGALGSVLFTLMPYYAPEKGWKEAMERAHVVGRKIYITLLLLQVFFALIYITILSLFADPLTGTIVLTLVDVTFLMHLKHQTFLELIDSEGARG